MENTFRETALKIIAAAAERSPEEWLEFYRQSYPDITPQESAELYPLFLQATDSAQTATERDRSLKRYQRLLEPIKKRNAHQKGLQYGRQNNGRNLFRDYKHN